MSYRTNFDKSKNYIEVLFHGNQPVAPEELNCLQEILSEMVRDSVKCITGNRRIYTTDYGEGWLVQPGTYGNTVVVSRGWALFEGYPALLQNDYIVEITEAEDDRTDYVVVDIYTEEIDASDDPDMVIEELGRQTSTRKKLNFDILYFEGSISEPPESHAYITVAKIKRKAGATYIDKDDITMEVPLWMPMESEWVSQPSGITLVDTLYYKDLRTNTGVSSIALHGFCMPKFKFTTDGVHLSGIKKTEFKLIPIIADTERCDLAINAENFSYKDASGNDKNDVIIPNAMIGVKYKVIGRQIANNGAESDWIDEDVYVTISETIGTPANVAGTPTEFGVEFSWDAVEGAVGYEYVFTHAATTDLANPDFSGDTIHFTDGTSVKVPCKNGEVIKFKVRAVGKSGMVGEPAEVVQVMSEVFVAPVFRDTYNWTMYSDGLQDGETQFDKLVLPYPIIPTFLRCFVQAHGDTPGADIYAYVKWGSGSDEKIEIKITDNTEVYTEVSEDGRVVVPPNTDFEMGLRNDTGGAVTGIFNINAQFGFNSSAE